MNNQAGLGQRIRELRTESGLSLRECARRLGISAAFLSDVELGRRFPSEQVLEGMARVLESPLQELQRYDTRPPLVDIKRLAESNPAYSVALRKIIDGKVSPEALLKFAELRSKKKR